VNQIKISIIIPVYNTALYLKQCLDSIIDQTFADFECICINDGSTDSSQNILEDYSKKDPRFKIISQQNTGVSEARNTGLKTAYGKYIIFVDSDDWITKNHIKVLYDTIEKYGCDVVTAEAFFYNEKTKKTYTKKLPEKFYGYPINSEDIKQKIMTVLDICPCWCKIYKRDFLKSKSIYFQKCPMEDIIFIYDIFTSDCSIMFIKDTIYFYRKNIEGSATYNSPERIYSVFNCFRFLKQKLIATNRYEKFKKAFLSHTAKCFAFELEESKLSVKTLKKIFLNIKNEFFSENPKFLYADNIFYKARILLFIFCFKYNINYAVIGKTLKRTYLLLHKIK